MLANIQEDYVYNTYNKISEHFIITRAYLWKGIKDFIENKPHHSFILDAGCGNGKNMFRDDVYFLGFDITYPFLLNCTQKKKNVIMSNILNIPFKNDCFDYSICIAVIHHLETRDKRITAIKELLRVTKKDVFIQVWDNELSKRNMKKYTKLSTPNDYLIEWNTLDKRKYYRYYHLFNKEEILSILLQLNVKIKKIFNEQNNWIFIINKK